MLLQSVFKIYVAGSYIGGENDIHYKYKVLDMSYTGILHLLQNKWLYNQENQ